MLVRKLEPKKIGTWLRRLNKAYKDFLQGVCFLEKYDGLSESVAFG